MMGFEKLLVCACLFGIDRMHNTDIPVRRVFAI